MEILFINRSVEGSWKNYRQYLNPIAKKTAATLEISTDFECSVILVDRAEIHAINRDYRKIDSVTDVISFAMEEGESSGMPSSTRELGDIFINVDAIRIQAKDYGHSLKREFCFLFTHGLLHLLGFDHMNEEDETKMFGLQEVILDEIAKR